MWRSLKEQIGKVFSQNTDSLILIGPEGDFTHEEVEMCISAGFRGVSLGKAGYGPKLPVW
ncbi:MAG: RNA methyltransferase [Bacteroidales bacterium]|nr:RNA methyltransferase [Bacteroidales bacterium]